VLDDAELEDDGVVGEAPCGVVGVGVVAVLVWPALGALGVLVVGDDFAGAVWLWLPELEALDPPKNVVCWPLPVMECPATASDTV
jgi:hypothetical protein